MRRPDRRTRYAVAHDLDSWKLDERRGPPLVRYVDDLVHRVARRGAVIIGMHPAGTAPPPSWAASAPSLCGRS
jgi:hypothetical protein